MRKILFLTIALFSIATCCYSEGQDTIVLNVDTSKYQVKYFSFNQDIENLPPSLLKFVPDGYTALDTASGDLNFDQYADMIMVLKKNGEDTIPDGSERPLLILIAESLNSYRLAARNDNAVYCIPPSLVFSPTTQ